MGQLPGPLPEGGKLFAGLSLLDEAEIIRGRRRKLVRVLRQLGQVSPHHDNPIRIFERQRPQQRRIYDAEDRSVGADAQRERGHYDERHTWTTNERAQSIFDVLPNASPSTPPLFVSECDQWIDLRSASRRNQTRQQGHHY